MYLELLYDLVFICFCQFFNVRSVFDRVGENLCGDRISTNNSIQKFYAYRCDTLHILVPSIPLVRVDSFHVLDEGNKHI